MEFIDNLKRLVVVLCTEVLLFVLGLVVLYILYTKNCSVQDILNLILNPLNPLTLCILGIGAIGGGYVGVKMWENLNSNGGKSGQTETVAGKPQG